MKLQFNIKNYLFYLGLALSLSTSVPTNALAVTLASAPLAQSSSSSVQPNIMFVLDNSGSMSWTYLPDVTDNFRGSYGYQSAQCNGVYYNPNITYTPPLDAAGNAYADASFTNAYDDGFDTTTFQRNLNDNFYANRFVSEAANDNYKAFGSYKLSALGPYGAVYYDYSGTVTDKDYANTGSTFYTQCDTAIGAATTVFAKRKLSNQETTTITVNAATSTTQVSSIKVNNTELMSATSAQAGTSGTTTDKVATNIAAKITLSGFSASVSGNVITITGPPSAANYTPVLTLYASTITTSTDVFPETDANKLKNFANWYSYYRTRMLTMKNSAGKAFSSLDKSYRVGLTKISNSTSPVRELATFENAQRANWYSSFYGIDPNGGTPLREALANTGLYYAGKLSGVTDPAEFSCQQNFTILSTDGYWNGNDGFKLDGSTAVGNQDALETRPQFDGALVTSTASTGYARHVYTSTGTRISGGSNCSGSKKRGIDDTQTQTCTIVTTDGVAGSESCSGWSSSSKSYLSPYTSSSSSCVSSVSLPNPSTTPKVATSSTTTPGFSGGTSDTLADVAEYYYKTDLRTTTNCTAANGNTLCATPVNGVDAYDNVFTGGRDNSPKQHMTTFTLGLGADGLMKYSPNYLKGGSADFNAISTVTTTNLASTPKICSWQSSGVCNWPTPGTGGPENIDDLWHAAVNGRGTYFSAKDPTSLTSGISEALAGIKAQTGAAAAAATSSLNPVAGNNAVYVASYSTGTWTGNLASFAIDIATGDIGTTATWCVEDITGCTGSLKSKVSASSDSRVIKTVNSAGTALINFDASYAAANTGYFNTARISTLSQWSSLTSLQQTAATGTNLVNYLRGQYDHDDSSTNAGVVAGVPFDNRLYRKREAILGDTLESEPTYSGAPIFSYAYPGYSELVGDANRPAGGYKKVQASRAGMVYIAGNDGMLHAFSSTNGQEQWAYVPSMVIPDMWRLADKNYTALHHNYINGSPIISDICTANCTSIANAVWKTILVGGLNAGGRGYYALDITNPTSPTLLWEFTTMAGVGATMGYDDDDVGFSYGQPIITRKADGTWVVIVSSGYNNISPGDGKGHLYMLNAASGNILSKILARDIVAGDGDGLAKIQGLNAEPAGNLISYVYGGDLLGNVWRFNVNDTATTAEIGTGKAELLAILKAPSGTAQPITTTPILGKSSNETMVFVGTGQYLGVSDLTTTQIQTQYAIKDRYDTVGTLNNPAGSPRNTSTLLRSTLSLVTGTNDRATALTGTSSDKGWYADFDIATEAGERVGVDGKLDQGLLIVPSIVPSNTACAPGGHGWLNYFDYETGGAITSNIVSHRYDTTIAGIFDYYIEGKLNVKVVLSNGKIEDGNVPPPASASDFQGKRTLWRELIQ